MLSRDGTTLYADVPDTSRVEPFGGQCATAYGAATTANAELGRGLPEPLTVGGPDATSGWLAVGRTAVPVALVPAGDELSRVCERGRAVVDRLCGG